MQFRWDKDWPTLLGLVTILPEGLLIWLLLDAGLIPGVDGHVDASTFVTMFVVGWLGQWLFANGPMRGVVIQWRRPGCRVLGPRIARNPHPTPRPGRGGAPRGAACGWG